MADAALIPGERTAPQNLEAERSVLGAILIDNDHFESVVQLVAPEDFFRFAHQRIFEAMIELSNRREPIDLVTLRDQIARKGSLDEVGGPAYISGLSDGVPRTTNAEYYARIVKEKSNLRLMIHAATKILNNAYEGEEEVPKLLENAESLIFSIADRQLRRGFVSMSQLVHEAFPKIEKLFEHKRLITGTPSGFADLDEMTRGFQPGDMIIVAARPSMGKTSLVLNIAQHVALEPQFVVAFFSLEMSNDSLFFRMLSSESQIDSHRLATGALGEKDYSRISRALETFNSMKLFIDDTPGMGVLEMRAKCRRLASEQKRLDLVVIDYIQLMSARGRFENRTLELGAISRALKGLAKELNVPVVVLSQLSRAPESRSDHRPQLSDLRESGALEQDADVVIMIYRDDVYNKNPTEEQKGVAELIIAKQRNGPTGTVELAFLREQTRFVNLARGVH